MEDNRNPRRRPETVTTRFPEAIHLTPWHKALLKSLEQLNDEISEDRTGIVRAKPIDTFYSLSHVLVVGGWIRDRLLNKQERDFDFVVVDSHFNYAIQHFPRILEDAARRQGIVVNVETTLDFIWRVGHMRGTKLAMFRATFDTDHDMTLAGVDSKVYKIDFVTALGNLWDDYRRRDFTCNGLYLDPMTYDLIDMENRSLDDLRIRKCITCVRSPEEAFQEDSIRMLKAVKFHYSLKLAYEPSLKEFIITRGSALLVRHSIFMRGRIIYEYCNALENDYFLPIIIFFLKNDLLLGFNFLDHSERNRKKIIKRIKCVEDKYLELKLFVKDSVMSDFRAKLYEKKYRRAIAITYAISECRTVTEFANSIINQVDPLSFDSVTRFSTLINYVEFTDTVPWRYLIHQLISPVPNPFKSWLKLIKPELSPEPMMEEALSDSTDLARTNAAPDFPNQENIQGYMVSPRSSAPSGSFSFQNRQQAPESLNERLFY